MRSRKDRRRTDTAEQNGCQDNGREILAPERRKGRDRRKENLKLEERLYLLAEMPGIKPIPRS